MTTIRTRKVVFSHRFGNTLRAASTPTGMATIAPPIRVEARAIWMVTTMPSTIAVRISGSVSIGKK